MKEFFNKIWTWTKSTAIKVWAWVKSHVAISAVIAGILVVGIAAGIVLPIVLNNNGGSNNGSSSSAGSEEAEYVYRITVQAENGYGFPNLTVRLMDGSKEVAKKETNSVGNASFSDAEIKKLGEYTIDVDMPEGYVAVDANKKTVAVSGTQIRYTIKPSGALLDGLPTKKYQLGDIMHDFTVTDTTGTKYTLSEMLKEKDAVVLNFWYVQCGPCRSEFPSMNNAYISYWDEENKVPYSDKLEIIAISTMDNKAAVTEYKSTMGLQFPMIDSASDDGVFNRFTMAGVPTTVVIDRNGVIGYMHTGSIPSVNDFQTIFGQYLGDDYTTTILNTDQTQSGGEGEGPVEMIKPTVDNPLIDDVKAALGNKDEFSYHWDEDGDDAEYSWPWLISEDKQYIYTSNKGVDNSFASLYVKFTAQAGEAICFDYAMETEKYGLSGGDEFIVLVDGVKIHSLNGRVADWETCIGYVFEDHEAGEHELVFLYLKDGDISSGEDTVKIRNVRIENANDLNASDLNIDIIRQAATVKNDDANATTQYKNYVDTVYNEDDGYYHVGSENGPLLFANVMTSSNWSVYALYEIAMNGYCVMEGNDLLPYIDTMAWESSYNYVCGEYAPVTKQWKEILELVTEYTPAVDENKNIKLKNFNGAWHENEWLELCVYFDHYGNTPAMEDPLIGVTYNAAIDIYEGTTAVNVKFDLLPRGFKHKFVPQQTGTYHVYATGGYDTMCWLSDDKAVGVPVSVLNTSDQGVYILAEFSAGINATEENQNFNFYFHFEEGKTYYLMLAFFSTSGTGIYDVTIEYTPEVTETLVPCGTHITFGLDNQSYYYVQDGVDYAIGDDNLVHVKNADGSLGSVIYLDLKHPTWYSDGWWSLYDVAHNRDSIESYKLRGFTMTPGDKDFTDYWKKLTWSVPMEGETGGMVALTAEILENLVALTEAQSEFVKDDWLMFCYYYKPLAF